MSNLMNGLVDPHDIPSDDLEDYLASNHRGYLAEIQNRLWEVTSERLFKSGLSRPLCTELLASQLRICFELVGFAIDGFDQVERGPPKKLNKWINIGNLLSKRKDTSVWPKVVDPTWTTPIDANGGNSIPFVDIKNMANAQETVSLKGKLDANVHAERRPRKKASGMMTFEELIDISRRLKLFVDRHVIIDVGGSGWYIDSRREFRLGDGKQGDVTVIKISNKGAD